MLPSAAGTSFIQGWNPGDKESVSFDWTINNVLNSEMLYVVAFIQDASSKIVYQAASNDPDLNATSVRDIMTARQMSILVYPNPANSKAYIVFAETPAAPVEIQLFNHLGSMVLNGLVKPGTELFEFDASGLTGGIYFVRAVQNGRVRGTSKLVIMH
jgi:hypothetical protein